MPAKPLWLLRVPDIMSEVSSLGAPVIDRAAVEKLFRVRRRRAIDLMKRIGGFECGRTHIVTRDDVLAWLKQVEAGEEFECETRRKQRVVAQVDELHRHAAGARVRISVIARPARVSY